MVRGIYTVHEVANEVGCPVRTIQYYSHKRYIPPALGHDKSGRNYTDDHIRKAREIFRRSELKRIPLREIAEVINRPHNPIRQRVAP